MSKNYLKISKNLKNSHNSLIKFIFSTFLKCVCVEMKSILEKYENRSFFFRKPKLFLQEKKVFPSNFYTF